MITKEALDKFPKLATVAGEKNRVILHSVYCDGGRLIATNGYCLAIVTPDKLDLEPAIIPLDAISALGQHEAELSIDAGTVTVVDSYMTRTWHVDGAYPDVDQIIPTVSELTPYIELDARELLEVAVESHGHEYIILDSDGVVASQSKHEGGKNGAVNVAYRGSFSVAINASLLLDLAKAIMLPVKVSRRDTYPIRLYDQLKEYGPHVVKPVVSQEGFTSCGVIMPMHR